MNIYADLLPKNQFDQIFSEVSGNWFPWYYFEKSVTEPKMKYKRKNMAHFAQLDSKDIVINVIVVNNDAIDNLPFPQSEPVGIAFCQELYGANTIWAQTSYNGNFRYNYAGAGHTYIPSAQPNGAFVAPPIFPSWVLNTSTYQWQAPIPYPNDGKNYYWDEATLSWVPADPAPVP